MTLKELIISMSELADKIKKEGLERGMEETQKIILPLYNQLMAG